MGSRGDGSDVYDGVPSLAPSLARDGLGCHGHIILATVGSRWVLLYIVCMATHLLVRMMCLWNSFASKKKAQTKKMGALTFLVPSFSDAHFSRSTIKVGMTP